MNTRPTGFSGVPPPGPAMPVMATADVGAAPSARAPAAMACATSSDTAPVRSISAGSMPSCSTFAVFA